MDGMKAMERLQDSQRQVSQRQVSQHKKTRSANALTSTTAIARSGFPLSPPPCAIKASNTTRPGAVFFPYDRD